MTSFVKFVLEETIAELNAEIAAKDAEIAVADKLIEERNRVLDAIPCAEHGRCVPHAIEWAERMRVEVARLRAALEKIATTNPDSNLMELRHLAAIAREALGEHE